MNNNETWNEQVVQKVAPLEPIHSGRRNAFSKFN